MEEKTIKNNNVEANKQNGEQNETTKKKFFTPERKETLKGIGIAILTTAASAAVSGLVSGVVSKAAGNLFDRKKTTKVEMIEQHDNPEITEITE